MGQYIYLLKPTDPAKAASRDGWTAEDHETFDLHWANLRRASEDGRLVLAGRAQDPDGAGPAIVIFEADSDEEARHFLESEPFIQRGFATATLHPFAVALSRNGQ
jgi:uncharacterized protein YciI